MKSYLDLVPISAKVHKKQNRMSVFCIALAVFLVTVIFGMADMFIRSQIMQARSEDGAWHIAIRDITEEEASLIAARPEVTATSWYGVLNFRGDQGYTLSGKNVILCGSEESFLTKMQIDIIAEGAFPQKDSEVVITKNAQSSLGLKIGDSILIQTMDGTNLSYIISGFLKNVSKTMEEDSFGIFMNTKEFRSIYPAVESGKPKDYNSIYYVQFSTHCNIQNTISDMKSKLGLSDKQVSENTKLLGLLGQSGNSFILQIYGCAVVLFLLVLLAGIIMITSSLNSNIAERTEFFGLMRCIGATPKQIKRFVRKEALGWCRFGISFGIITGLIIIWILCSMLRFLSPDYFIDMPIFGISLPSVFAGICMGVWTVLLAALSPAKKASKVSPLVAVSGNATDLRPVQKSANTSLFKIDSALGIHHAMASKRNFILMVSSFSLSIILFLSFSVTIDFMNHSLTPLKPWTPDLSIISPDNSTSIRNSLLETLQDNPSIKKVYGRMFAYNIPAIVNGIEKKIDLVSYEKNQFKWATDYLLEGSIQSVMEEENTGLVVFKQNNTATIGDMITLHTKDGAKNIKVTGLLSASPFNNASGIGTIICSEPTFWKIIGKTGYTIIDLQLSKHATENDVNAIHQLIGAEFTFSDNRLSNKSVIGSYYSFGLFIYGFMTFIALITIFNIVNSISMSVSARIKQYGAFRAIGLSNLQLKKMILAETLTYAITGSICGCIIGLPLNLALYERLVTFHWGEPWKIPYAELAIILLIVALSVVIAVQRPVKRIRNMSIVDTISAK